jgi:regulator of sigma E protease
MGTITFLLVLSVLVFIHELGHFSAARYFGVTVHVFSIGFGKKIYSKMYKGTQWSISLIPLGGYVKMKGQDDMNPAAVSKDKDSYNALQPWQRIVILFAGPAANFILAAFLYFAIALMGSNALSPTIGKVLPNSPALKAGLQVNDEIIRINDTPIRTWDELSKVIKVSDQTMKFVIKRNNKIYIKTIRPHLSDTQNMFREKVKKLMIGIAPAPKIVVVHYSIGEALTYAFDKTYDASKMIFLGVQKMIQGIIPSSEVGGVITIGKVISDASQSGIIALFTIMALVSVNLGVLNLLPIPALDGGHIMFNLYEIITRRKPSQNVLVYLTIGGWVLLAGLMGLGMYNDIVRLLNN